MICSDNGKYKNKILTIPNLLSLLRLCMIPIIVWLYSSKKEQLWALLVLLLSGATDIIDGIIARRFNMISDFGKALDPVADKLTQIAMLFCLVSCFPYMTVPLVLLVVKEIIAAILNMIAIKKTRVVTGAVWHGKLTTVLLYCTMAIHLAWFNIPAAVSNALIAACTAAMLFSAVQYTIRSIRVLTDKKIDSVKKAF